MNPDEKTSYTTRDGRQIAIRRMTPQDAPLLVDLYYAMSETTRRLRFHSVRKNVSLDEIEREAQQLSQLDPAHQAALVATESQEGQERIVAVARMARIGDSEEAESAIVVRDDYQNQGLGTHLLTQLAQVAPTMNIKRLTAWVMAENLHMLHIIKKSGLEVQAETRYGETYISVPV